MNNAYRFAEIEMIIAVQHLENLKIEDTHAKLLDIIGPLSEEELSHFYDRTKGTESRMFRRPLKKEVLYMLRMKGMGYNKITKLTGISPNSALKWVEEFDENSRWTNRHPVFSFWNRERLDAWNQAKRSLNLFEEKFKIKFQ